VTQQLGVGRQIFRFLQSDALSGYSLSSKLHSLKMNIPSDEGVSVLGNSKPNYPGSGRTGDKYMFRSKNLLDTISQEQSGVFYFEDLNYQELNFLLNFSEFKVLPEMLDIHNKLIGTLRWSYRYNPLHRRSLYNSHKLTESKKLLSAGFFDTQSLSNNL
jgi:hypothetical protein